MRIKTATVVAIAALAMGLAACEDPVTTIPTSGGPVATTVAGEAPPSTTTLTASEVQVKGTKGKTSYDVAVPQVEPGTSAAAKEFDQGMRALLQARIDDYQVTDNGPGVTITDTSKLSKVEHIGAKVVSGLLWVSVDGGGAHPWTDLSTHVTNLETGSGLELSDLFVNEEAGLKVLAAQAAELGPKSRAGENFDPKGATAKYENFQVWTATPDGMHVYFGQGQVGPSAMGPVDITIPWSELSGVLEPGLKAVLAS